MFCMCLVFSCNGGRVQPKQETATPKAPTGKQSAESRRGKHCQPVKHCKRRHRTSESQHTEEGEPDKRQQAGQCVYIMLYYVNAFVSRRAYELPAHAPAPLGGGGFFLRIARLKNGNALCSSPHTLVQLLDLSASICKLLVYKLH